MTSYKTAGRLITSITAPSLCCCCRCLCPSSPCSSARLAGDAGSDAVQVLRGDGVHEEECVMLGRHERSRERRRLLIATGREQ